ncbi:glycerol-3-phosphate 1-O-acyltransferase PlsY [Lapidilactobacillus luobeiensis]|uniref:glycerol-3-phosphate 1-O-acyltransferase PlsY n=1 Tax=Lapidilactobacillus luobeiensis TaxID=2950371 RepID=UPI0040391CDE
MKIAVLIILAYLLGAFPSGVVVGKLFYHQDIRQFGSGNIGTTNTFRVLGRPAGLIVLALDILKGTAAASLPVWFHLGLPHYMILAFGVAAILGHSFSIFIKFAGGKAVATSAGVLLAYNPSFFVIAASTFVIIMLVSSMVSVASMLGMILITIFSVFYHDVFLTTLAVVLTIFIFIRHRENIKRIRKGEENLVPFGWYYHYRQKHQH